ncbi:MAG: PAS domain S-box protein [Pseudobdellovibrio sp.]
MLSHQVDYTGAQVAIDNAFFKSILSELPSLIACLDLEFKYTYVNSAYGKWFGITQEQCLNRSAEEVLGREVMEMARPFLNATLQGEKQCFERYVPYKNGSKKIHVQYLPLHNSNETIIGIAVIVHDLSELSNRDEKLKLVFENIENGIVIHDSNGKIIEFNPASLTILGVSPEQLLGFTSMNISWKVLRADGSNFPGEDHPAMVALRTGSKIVDTIMRVQLPDGNERWVNVCASPFNSKGNSNNLDPSQRNVLVTFTDLTARMKAEAEQQESVSFIRAIANNTPGMLAYWKKDLICAFSNQENLDCFGRTSEQMQGISMQELIGIESFKKNESHIKAVLSGNNQQFERVILKPDGKTAYLWVQYISNYVQKELQGFFTLITDITPIKIAEKQALHASKLASLGEMAAGIVHEIRNPLSIILGHMHVLHKYVNDPEKFLAKTKSIKEAAARINKIANGLSKFSRVSDESSYSHHSVSKIIEDSLILVESNAKINNTAISYEIKKDSYILCEEIEIEQVMINLVNNSIDAIKNNPNKWIKIELLEELNSVVIRVIDSGLGIPEQYKEKIFDSFFTTKKIGEGTGLGLSIIKGILNRCGGNITIDSNCPNTCFEIRFPIANPKEDTL